MLGTLVGLGSMAMPYITSAIGLGKDYFGKGWDLTKAGAGWLGDNLVGVGAIAGGLSGIGSSLFGSKSSAKSQYKYQSMLQQQAYNLQKQGFLEFPSAQRQGLENAGYNPMLALGGLGSASYSGGSGSAGMAMPDIAGSARAGSQIVKDFVGLLKAQIDNIKSDTKLKEGQLSAVETQRLQTEANTALLESQADRTALAYGRDIVDTVTGIAGTGASLYSAKAMADVARQNALTNRENAKTNRQNADRLSAGSERVTTHTDKNGKPLSETIQSDTPNRHSRAKDNGVPAVTNSAKGVKPNAASSLGHSAKMAGGFAKEVAKELLLFAPFVSAGMALEPKIIESSHNYQRKYKGERYWQPKRVLLH